MDNINWIKFKETTQILPPLLLDCVARGFARYFTQDHDHRTKIRNYGQFLNGRWFGKVDFQNYQKMLQNAQPSTLIRWARAYRTKKLKLYRYAIKVSKMSFQNISDNILVKIFARYIELCASAYHFVYDYVILNTFYAEKINTLLLTYIKDVSEMNRLLPHITGLDRPTEIHRANRELVSLALDAQRFGFTTTLKEKIKQYVNRYGYLNMFTYIGKPFEIQDIEREIKRLMRKTRKKLLQEREEKIISLLKNRNKTNEFIKKFRVKKSDQQIIKVLKTYLYTSLWADELYHKIPYLIKPLLLAIAKRLYVTYEQLIYLTSEELLSLLKKGKSSTLHSLIRQRQKEFAFIYQDKKIRILTGTLLKKFVMPIRKSENRISRLKELSGEPASPGRVMGEVQIIKTLADINNFMTGRILVATSTAPTHIPAMKRAIAFITDEGGLLSHAAIIAREFKKPCIVGTKIATKVLKNGDLVEVDATKGVVRKICKK